MVQFIGLQRVGHNWATELNWSELKVFPMMNRTFLGRTLWKSFMMILFLSSYLCHRVFPDFNKWVPGGIAADETKEELPHWTTKLVLWISKVNVSLYSVLAISQYHYLNGLPIYGSGTFVYRSLLSFYTFTFFFFLYLHLNSLASLNEIIMFQCI